MLKIMTTVKLGWVSMETLFKQPQRLTAEMSEVSDWSQHLDQRLLVVNLPPLPRPLIPPLPRIHTLSRLQPDNGTVYVMSFIETDITLLHLHAFNKNYILLYEHHWNTILAL